MGYYIDVRSADFHVSAKQVDRLRVAVNTDMGRGFMTIHEVFDAFSWTVDLDESGAITSINSDEMIRLDEDEELFMNVIVPYVQSGSYIEYEAGDGIYRRHFDGKKMHILEAEITFPDPPKAHEERRPRKSRTSSKAGRPSRGTPR